MADTKPIYKRVNGEWKKQTAFQRQNGEWVKISDSVETKTLPAGLYDENDNLVASWDTLVNTYGLDIEKNYTDFDETTTGHSVLNNVNLANGKKIVIDNNVTSIGENAFSSCSSLTSIVIPAGVTSIGNYAFKDCTNLTEINFNATNCVDLSLNNYVFYNAGIKGAGITVTFGDGVTRVPAYLFDPTTYEAPKIVSVIFAENGQLTSIGDSAFYNCKELTSITIPDSVTSIDNWAFAHCYALTNVVLGTGVTHIGQSVFCNCHKLPEITIPNSVISIGHGSFNGCPVLEKTHYIGTIDQWVEITFENDEANPLWVSNALYINGELVTDVVLTSATNISNYAFYNCDSLKSIVIPSSVTSIGERAFGGCDKLTIYCEAESKPIGWASTWNLRSGYNGTYCPVVWGYKQ